MKYFFRAIQQFIGFKRIQTFVIILFSGLFISSCDDLLSTEEQAEKAAVEMCECIKENSLNTCKEKLNDKYGHHANDNDFIKTFNNAQDCGITIYKEKQ